MATTSYTSKYDEKYLSKEDYDLVQKYKQDYANATTAEEKQAAHAGAEAIRDKYSYSGGTDGSQYVSNRNLNVSPDTDQMLNKYSTYTPSESVTAAQNYLNQVQSSKPGGYVSKWESQISDIYNKIVNREDFQYDLNQDMLYQQYKDQYTGLGQLAMMDTIGQASGLTGGYANTYAQNAGQQAYQSYLKQLNEVVPELYGMARDQYNQETQELYNQFSMTQSLDDTDYGRYRDTVSDYYNDLNYAASRVDAERSYDLNQFSMNQNYALTIAGMESDNNWAQTEYEAAINSENRSYAYDTAMGMLQSGIMPSADMLKTAGISAADAQSIISAYQISTGGGGRGYGGGGGSDYDYDSGDGGSAGYSDASRKNFQASYNSLANNPPQLSNYGRALYNGIVNDSNTTSQLAKNIEAFYEKDQISLTEYNYLVGLLEYREKAAGYDA